jgi:hypothetical protein
MCVIDISPIICRTLTAGETGVAVDNKGNMYKMVW